MIGITAEQMHTIPGVIGVVYGLAKVCAVLASVRGGLVNSVVAESEEVDQGEYVAAGVAGVGEYAVGS